MSTPLEGTLSRQHTRVRDRRAQGLCGRCPSAADTNPRTGRPYALCAVCRARNNHARSGTLPAPRAVRLAVCAVPSRPASDYPPHLIDALFERARLSKRPWLRAQTERVA